METKRICQSKERDRQNSSREEEEEKAKVCSEVVLPLGH